MTIFTPPPDNFRVYDREAEMAKAREMQKTYEIPLAESEPSPILLAGPWEAADPIVPGTRVGFHLYLEDAARRVHLNGRTIVDRGAGKYTQFTGAFFSTRDRQSTGRGLVVLKLGAVQPVRGTNLGRTAIERRIQAARAGGRRTFRIQNSALTWRLTPDSKFG